MTKQLEALIAEMKAAAEAQDKYMRGGAFSIAWDESITPKNVMTLIAALEQSDCERNKAYRQASAARNAFDEQYQLRDAAEKRIAELEASPLAVKLPDRKDIRFWPGDAFEFDTLGYVMAVEKAIRAAGGKVEGE
ncbi:MULTISPECIES: hypothetical protein [unclassified Cedecea]|uniref:hypothetical protein n=1 Tax=unclassified Cedecea TaxID=2649846 RepID=UPI003016340A